MADFHLEVLLLLFIAAFVAGYLDTLAGGGGLITLPSLMLAGLPITAAIGTNKLQSTFGSMTATIVLLRKRKIDIKVIYLALFTAFLGGMVGAIAVLWIDRGYLKWVVPVALIAIIFYFLFSKKDKEKASFDPIKIAVHTYLISPLIGFYDGFLGPGTGSFFAASNLHFRSLDFVAATVYAKPLNAATNIAALLVFIFTDTVNWVMGIAMIFGQVAGSYFAAERLHSYSPIFLRRLVVIVSLILLVSYMIRELFKSATAL